MHQRLEFYSTWVVNLPFESYTCVPLAPKRQGNIDNTQVYLSVYWAQGFPDSSVGKESACNAEDPGWGRSPGGGIGYPFQYSWASLVTQLVKNPPALQDTWVQSLGCEDPLERERLPTPVLWPGEFHGLYSPWGYKESDTTE